MSLSGIWAVAVLWISAIWALWNFPSGWWGILGRMAGGLWPPGPHLAGNLGTGLLGVLGAAFLVFLFDSAGIRVLRMVTGKRPGGALRLSAFFFGYALLSMMLFGLAMASLWFPPVLWIGLALFAVFASAGFPGAWRDWAGGIGGIWGLSPVPGKIIWVMVALWWFPLVAGPETNADCMQYHLGFPGQILLAHKYIGRGIYLAWGYPLLVEMPNVFALLARLDGLAHAMRPVMALLGCLALVRGLGLWPGPALGTGVAWLALMAPSFAYVLGYSKNDAFAAGALLAMAGLLVEGGAFLKAGFRVPLVFASGLLAGIMLATKHTMLVPVSVFLLSAAMMTRHRDRLRYLAVILPAVLLVPLGWWAKAWLFIRDPFYPLGAVFMPGLFGDPGLGGAERLLYRIFIQGGRPPGMLPMDLWELVSKSSIMLLASVPFIYSGVPAGIRRVLAVSLLALLGMVMAVRGSIGDLERFCLPVFALWNAVGLSLLVRGMEPGNLRRAAIAALLLLGGVFHLRVMATQGEFFREAPVSRWLSGRDGGEEYRRRALVSYGAILPEVRKTCADGRGRILAVGETFSWGIPVRIVAEGFEAPFTWKSAYESPSPERVAVRWKQAGIRWVLYNHMISSWTRFQEYPFEWSPQVLRRYADFALPRFVLRARSGRYDPGVGSDTLYEVLSRPSFRPPSRMLFLPGIEPGLSYASLAWLSSEFNEAQARFNTVRKALPEVTWLLALEAQCFLDGGKPREALKLVRLAEENGFEDDISLFTHASAAGRTGLKGEAEAVLERAHRACPLMDDRADAVRREAGLPTDRATRSE